MRTLENPPLSLRRKYLLLGISLLACLPFLTACGGSDGDTPSNNGRAELKIPASKLPPVVVRNPNSGDRMGTKIEIHAGAAEKSFTLKLPPEAVTATLQVSLDGADVTKQFTPSSCGAGTCYRGALPNANKIKHVLRASVSGPGRTAATGKHRFVGMQKPEVKAGLLGSSYHPSWEPLPPTLGFTTVSAQGWSPPSGTAWFNIDGQDYPNPATPLSAPCQLNVIYVAVVMDRKSLQEMEGSPYCFTGTAGFNAFVKTIPNTQIIVGGTTFGAVSDTSLDTTAIGGQNMSGYNPTKAWIIGVGGQASGSAYYPWTDPTTNPNYKLTIDGTFQEDAEGNYNFQPSDVVQFVASPNDPSYFTDTQVSTFVVDMPQSMQWGGFKTQVFTAPAGTNGVWLLQLDRRTLAPNGSTCVTASGKTPDILIYKNCGTFYSTDSDAGWNDLANALNSMTGYVVPVVMTVGTVKPLTVTRNWSNFAAAAQNFGMTPQLLGNPQTGAGADYSYVGYRLYQGNALTGSIAESSSALLPQGQTGFMRGILQRNTGGLFQVAQTSQEIQPIFAAKGGIYSSDYVLASVAYKRPVQWPSSSSVLLPGAVAPNGQYFAFQFLSFQLLRSSYVPLLTGPEVYDIHSQFTSSVSPMLDWNKLDPASIPFPSVGDFATQYGCSTIASSTYGSVCFFNIPEDAPGSVPRIFFEGDWKAVQNQLKIELQYLSAVQNYLEGPSPASLRNITVDANSGGSSALINAIAQIANSVWTNAQKPPPTAHMSVSWQAMLNLLGSVWSAAANFTGVGDIFKFWGLLSEESQNAVKVVTGISNTLGSALTIASNASGLVTSNSTAQRLPSSFGQFSATIAELSSANVASNLGTGFDSLSDSILSDWGRLSAIAPRTGDPTDPVFYSNTAASREPAMTALQTGTTASFYMALLPTYYNVHYWPNVIYGSTNTTVFEPRIGQLIGKNDPYCLPIYVTKDNQNYTTLPLTSGTRTIARDNTGGIGQDFGESDVYVFAGITQNPGTDKALIESITPELGQALFSPNQLNIPMMQLLHPKGPMSAVFNDMSVAARPGGFASSVICDAE